MDVPSEQSGRARRTRRRVQKERQFHTTDPICEALLVAVVTGSALAIGTVHPASLLVISALALVGGTLAAFALQRIPAPALLIGALGLFSALQAVPLPAQLVAKVSPMTASVWLHCLSPLREGALRRFSVSLDPGASVAEGLKWLTYAAVYVMAARARARRGSGWLAVLLFGSAALVSFITLLHGAGNVQTLYGIYKPNFGVRRWNLGPLLNSNNFAGYANLGLFAGVGVLLNGKPNLPRLPSFIALGVISVALLLSTSRAGISSTVAGAGVLAFWWSRQRQGLGWVRGAVISLGLLGVSAIAVIGYAASRNWTTWAPADVERKIAVWRWSMTMIAQHPWLGVGRGAFETALPVYRLPLITEDWTALHSHAENFVLQWVSEWGIPIGVSAVTASVGYLLIHWYAVRGDRLRFALLTGLDVLLVQNLADLGLEIPALAIAAVVALAAGVASTAPKVTAGDRKPSWSSSLVLSVPFFGLLVAAAMWSRLPVEPERRELSLAYRALSVSEPDELASFRSQLRQAILRHPGEAHFPLLGAVVAYRARDQAPLPWIARALEVAPTNGRVHLVLGELLGAHHLTSQAMLHLRLAASYDGTLGSIAAARAAQWAPTLDVMLEAIPPGEIGHAMLSMACSAQRKSELKLACLRYAAKVTPNDVSVQAKLADVLLLALNSRRYPCTGEVAMTCAQEADAAARAIASLDPSSWRPGYIIAEVLMARGDARAAAELLHKTCLADVVDTDCSRASVIAAVASGSDDAMLAAAEAYSTRACGGSGGCSDALDWIAGTLDSGGKPSLALSYFSKAAEADSSAARWLKVAERAARANMYGLSRTALDRADHSPDANPNSRAHSASLRVKIARGLIAGSL